MPRVPSLKTQARYQGAGTETYMYIYIAPRQSSRVIGSVFARCIRESMPSNIRLARMNYNGPARSGYRAAIVRAERARDISGARERETRDAERAHPAGPTRTLRRFCVPVVRAYANE